MKSHLVKVHPEKNLLKKEEKIDRLLILHYG